jgi:hypothetical protein
MSYSYQYHTPAFDASGKPLDPGIQGPSLPYVNSPGGTRQPAVVKLWREQVVAVSIGLITLVLGILVLAAYLRTGPLYTIFIPFEDLSGPIVNTANIGAAIAALATLISRTGRYVAVGISRAWLRRRAVRSEGASVRQWRTISAGVSLRDARRTPLLAGGIILLFTIAMGLNGAALAGAGIPAAILQTYASSHGPVVPFRGNGGEGSLVNCVSVAEGKSCASIMSLSDLSNAFGSGLGIGSGVVARGAHYLVAGRTTISTDRYLAALPPTSANVTDFGAPPSTYAELSIVTPVSAYSAQCSQITDVGIRNADEYYYESQCSGQFLYFGDASIESATYLTAVSCYSPSDLNTYRVEVAVANAPRPPGTIIAYSCDVTGFEGMGVATSAYGGATYIEPTSPEQFQPLTVSDMNSTVTAFIAAIKAEVGLDGKLGPLGGYLSLAFQNSNAADILAIAVSNTLAASASYGYMALLTDDPKDFSTVYDSLPLTWSVRGFGWTKSSRSLGWSITCLLISFAWLVSALYMTGGGTRYDPTDWYQTINTSAGSNLTQLPGTCTGAGLQAKKVNKIRLWYGELGPGHVGFAHQRTAELLPKGKYGDASGCV